MECVAQSDRNAGVSCSEEPEYVATVRRSEGQSRRKLRKTRDGLCKSPRRMEAEWSRFRIAVAERQDNRGLRPGAPE
jgi:hypothetical protein